jgi:hypothetical protein
VRRLDVDSSLRWNDSYEAVGKDGEIASRDITLTLVRLSSRVLCISSTYYVISEQSEESVSSFEKTDSSVVILSQNDI